MMNQVVVVVGFGGLGFSGASTAMVILGQPQGRNMGAVSPLWDLDLFCIVSDLTLSKTVIKNYAVISFVPSYPINV